MTMDDPTTDLYRDPTRAVLVVAGSTSSAMDLLKSYGVSIQTPSPIRVITNSEDALLAVAGLPHTTPWCMVTDGLWDAQLRQIMVANFGPAKTIHEALTVENHGVARVPGRYPWERPT
jgi:hypothetical protein